MIDRYTGLKVFLLWLVVGLSQAAVAQEQSVARLWNERMLFAIERDFARPPMQARNLFHVSAAMYDAWAAYGNDSDPWLLGQSRGGYDCAFDGVAQPSDVNAGRREAVSFAAYRMIRHRFVNSPGAGVSLPLCDALMDDLGYDRTNTSTAYVGGGPAELGNYIAAQYIAFGMQDGSNEASDFENQYYLPVNPSLHVEEPGNPTMIDPNRWQEVTLTVAIDQQGNPVPGTRPFIGPEWGNVVPFAMGLEDITTFSRDGTDWSVYHDPGPPAYLDTADASGLESFFKWNHLMVAVWQSHLDPADDVMWDISPASIGNNQSYPSSPAEYHTFYDFFNGNDAGQGHALNPVTSQPYEPQLVKRGDYARVLAEFWADGPNSETPPGHWYSILHTVQDHPLFERRWMGQGDELDQLDYDIKAHMALGGSLHDAAITAWSIKGWYDYVRPVSAIRYMGDRGQCSDPGLPNYHKAGLPLIPGYVELVEAGDPLAGDGGEHVGKVKLYTWRGPTYIAEPATDHAGVGWILAENWYPYQRPTFVTPPFAGYVSGHSTYSRTAAEVLTLITGDPYFPGGVSNFVAQQNEFLVFEEGPSTDIILQWATYRDASDQCSLSRIWGGIHPPIDDIPGRLLGQLIGPDAVIVANDLFNVDRPMVASVVCSAPLISMVSIGSNVTLTIAYDRPMDMDILPELAFVLQDPAALVAIGDLTSAWTGPETLELQFTVLNSTLRLDDIHLRISGGYSADGTEQNTHLAPHPFLIDTEPPALTSVTASHQLINEAVALAGSFTLTLLFSEDCDIDIAPGLILTGSAGITDALLPDVTNSGWLDGQNYLAAYTVVDTDLEGGGFGIEVSTARDAIGNPLPIVTTSDLFHVDTRGPQLASLVVSDPVLNLMDIGSSALSITIAFDEEMIPDDSALLLYSGDDPLASSLTVNPFFSGWLNEDTWRITYDLANANEEAQPLAALMNGFADLAGNLPVILELPSPFLIDTHRPTVNGLTPSVTVVSDNEVGMGGFYVDVHFAEPMNTAQIPLVQLTSSEALGSTFQYSPSQSFWLTSDDYRALFNVADAGLEVSSIDVSVNFASDQAGNAQDAFTAMDILALDTRNPEVIQVTTNVPVITDAQLGTGGFVIYSEYDEPMHPASQPMVAFNGPLEIGSILTHLAGASQWVGPTTYANVFSVSNVEALFSSVGLTLTQGTDVVGNVQVSSTWNSMFSIDLSGTGISEAGNSSGLSIYPNPLPSGHALQLRMDQPVMDAHLQVFDTRGERVVHLHLGRLDLGLRSIALPALAAGVYQLTLLTAEHMVHTQRLVLLGP